MKKLLVLSALAAVSTAFVACSSDDDLVQQAPEVPQTKGTPFSVSIQNGTETRATLYNADAWNKTNSTTWVNAFKLYGKQGSNDPWMNNVVFARAAYDADWVADRSAAEATVNPADLTWPVADKTTPTSFYAITDGAVGTGTSATIAGVSEWMTTPGSFVYEFPTTTSDILWYKDNAYDFENNVYNSYTYVTNANLTDLMVASSETVETTDGVLSLGFTHALAGLTIKAMFVSNAENQNSASATVKSVMVCGLDGAGTYTFGASTPWASNTKVNYYYELPTPLELPAEAETGTHTPQVIVPAGTWLAIPQTVTAWDEKLPGTDTYPTEGAYIAVRIHDSVGDLDYILCFPLATTLNAAKNRVITINIADGRDVFGGEDTNEGNNFAGHFYTPAQSIVI